MEDRKPVADLRFGDCVQGMVDIPDESIDMTVTSIPFGALFSYSHKTEDIGNNIDGTDMVEGQFALHFRFFIDQLYRIHKPGTIVCIHIQQLLRWKVQHGYMGKREFRGAVVSMMLKHGWQEHGEVAIPKNPRNVAKRLQLHSLMFVTASRDGRKLAPAMNDYVLFFKKPGEDEKLRGLIETDKCVWLETMINQNSVNSESLIEFKKHPMIVYDKKRKRKSVAKSYKEIPYDFTVDYQRGIVKSVVGGEHINPDGWFTKTDWVKWAHGVWDDILEIDVLEGWKCSKDNEEEKHICPLQKEVIRRCVNLYSAPGEKILDPFMGIGSSAYVAIEQGRDVIGFELKESYYDISLRNVQSAFGLFYHDKEDDKQMTFDFN